ncbi:hypothetical protein M0R45_005247 [Rubus argutus]|uniref:Uncharacterized protein n=1 Tax=Rubus argutus TaxID=59490 RepID=A0AAW1YM41_RUBAR
MYDHIHKLQSQFFGNYQIDKVVERNSIHYERCLIVVDSRAFVRSLAPLGELETRSLTTHSNKDLFIQQPAFLGRVSLEPLWPPTLPQRSNGLSHITTISGDGASGALPILLGGIRDVL